MNVRWQNPGLPVTTKNVEGIQSIWILIYQFLTVLENSKKRLLVSLSWSACLYVCPSASKIYNYIASLYLILH